MNVIPLKTPPRAWIQHFTANLTGRDFIVGDIHGCLTELLQLLLAVGFNPEKDRLFSVGDLIDRGPQSLEVLALLEKPWFFAVRGNHEQMLLDFLTDPDHNAPYDESFIPQIHPDSWDYYVDLIRQMPHVIKVHHAQPFYIMHAEIWEPYTQVTDTMIDEFQFNDEDHTLNKVLWSRHMVTKHQQQHHPEASLFQAPSLSRIFCGHTIVHQPIQIERTIYLDTGSFVPYTSSYHAHERYGLTMVNPHTLQHWFAPTTAPDRGSVFDLGRLF